MKRLLCLFGFALCLFAANSFTIDAYAQSTPEIAKGNCQACEKKCEEVLRYCNTKGSKYAAASVTTALKDCIAACKLTDEYFARGSSLAAKAATFNSDACINCAKVCEGFKDDDKMNACANECRKTAGNCSKVK
jgi:hypothetical protein